MSTLKPCAHCATDEVTVMGPSSASGRFWGECEKCGATGGYRGTYEEAIAAWNRRPAEDAQSATIARLERRVETLEAALEPFSEMAGPLFEHGFNRSDSLLPQYGKAPVSITAGDFFTARRTLKGAQ